VDLLGTTHLWAALLAMLAGAVVLMSRKGTQWHRRWGWLYVAAMATVIATALLIYDLFGTFGPFHVAALISVVTVTMGLLPALRRRPKGRWVSLHASWMSGSYVGLIAAATSEIATRYLDWSFGATVIAASTVVTVVGVVSILALVPGAIRRMAAR
jgi:uncharacterized membrane protein